MVLAGQFLERSVVVGDLDALYHRGTRDPPCAIAAPHPALGGSMVSPVVAELAWALTRAGHPTLRFDYRGVGASRGISRHPAGGLRIADLQLLEEKRQPPDHPALLSFPEGKYLKFFVFRKGDPL